jgi:hypothetical protein
MAKTWGEALPVKGMAWDVPAADITEMADFTASADKALLRAESSGRSPVTTVRHWEALEAMVEKMRLYQGNEQRASVSLE